jgi:c-di-GMP-binding flagellar brake protein YcgR
MSSSTLSQIDTALPSERTIVDVVGVADGRVCTSFVERVAGDVLSLSIPRDRSGTLVPESGTRLELVWKHDSGFLAVPVVVALRESGADAAFRVQRTGPTARGQRRAAVRAPLRLPVQFRFGEHPLSGLTVDISEGGLRCVLDRIDAVPDADDGGSGEPELDPGSRRIELPALGDRLSVTIIFNSVVVETHAEVVRRPRRQDERTELSLRFVGIPEVTQDLIRRQVFSGLRDLRLRGLI